jgi:Flagellar hook-length control protein FliK
MGGAINLLSGSGQVSETANARQGIQDTGFRAVFGAATKVGAKASDQPVPTPPVSTPREILLDRLGEVRERALANVAPDQVEGQMDASGELSELVSSLALAVAEFDQDTGLGLTPALRSGLTPEVVGGGLATADPAAIPDTLGGDVPEPLNDSLQALVAVVGFMERTARVLPLPPVGLPGVQLADGAIFGAKGGGTIAQGENIPAATTGKAAGVLAGNPPPVAYAATLSQEAVGAGTVSIPEQPRPGLLRGAESGAIGSRTSPAVITDPRLVPSSVGLPGAPDPAPALLGQVVAQAFTALETARERGVGLIRERRVELNPLSGSEIFLRTQPGTERPGLERTAGSGAPERSRFAAALTAQIRATEGRTLIELSPRGLGQVEVDIRTETDGSMKVTIRADNLMVLNTLRDAREMLAQLIGAADGTVLDFQEGPPGQDQGRQGPALAQGFKGDDEGSATAAGQIAQSEVIGGGQLDIMT